MTEVDKAKEIESKVIEKTQGAAGMYLDPIYGFLTLCGIFTDEEVPYEEFVKTMCAYYHKKAEERGYLWTEKLEEMDNDTLMRLCFHYAKEAYNRGLIERNGELV